MQGSDVQRTSAVFLDKIGFVLALGIKLPIEEAETSHRGVETQIVVCLSTSGLAATLRV